jgi:hypothetical protein
MRRQVVGCRMLFASLRWIIGCATIRPTSPADRPIYILVYMLHSIFCRLGVRPCLLALAAAVATHDRDLAELAGPARSAASPPSTNR